MFHFRNQERAAVGQGIQQDVTQPIPDVSVPRITAGAFAASAETAKVLEAAAEDRRMARVTMSVRHGGIPAAVDFYGNAPVPNLLIVESDSEREALFGELDRLAEECTPGTKVIVIGRDNDVYLYRELMERGVTDYLVSPLDPVMLIASVAKAYRGECAAKLGRITAFIGARGGVGSSTVAHNVAAASSFASDARVLLVDLDMPFGSAGLNLNIDPSHGTAEILLGAESVDDLLIERLSAKHGDRLQVLAALPSFDRNYDIPEDQVEKLLEVAQAGAGHVLLDLPQSWTAWSTKILRGADEVVLTATPDLLSMRNAKQMAEFLMRTRPNDAPPRLVLNQIGVPKRPEIKPDDFASAVKLRPTASIAFDATLFGTAANNGQTVVQTSGKSAPAKAFADLAQVIGGKKEAAAPGKRAARSSFMGRLFGRRRG